MTHNAEIFAGRHILKLYRQ